MCDKLNVSNGILTASAQPIAVVIKDCRIHRDFVITLVRESNASLAKANNVTFGFRKVKEGKLIDFKLIINETVGM